MKERRWLLPFTFGVDVRAIDLVIRLAKDCGATLVPASLIVVSEILQEQGPRLEYIQQSKDFLEAVRWKAAMYDVAVEPHEVWTGGIHERIKRLALDLQCSSVVVVTDGKEGILLDTGEVANLLTGTMPASITLVCMPAPEQSAVARLKTRFFSWVKKLREQRSAVAPSLSDPYEQDLLREKSERIPQRNAL
jgi:hypothetical protein